MRVSQPSQSDGLAVSVDADGRLLRWDRTLQSAHLMTTGSDTAVPDRVTSLCVLRNDDVAIGGWSGAVYIVSHCPTRVKQVTPQKKTHTHTQETQTHKGTYSGLLPTSTHTTCSSQHAHSSHFISLLAQVIHAEWACPDDVVPWVSSVSTWSDDSTEVLAITSAAGAVRTVRRESMRGGSDGNDDAGATAHSDFTDVASAVAPVARVNVTDSFAPKLVGAAMVRRRGDSVLVTSDTHGECHLQHCGSLEATGRFVAHIAPVTALASLGSEDDRQGHLVTASANGRIKVWKLAAVRGAPPTPANASSEHAVQQTGEFACRSGVTSLAVVGNTVFCGDALGFVYLLDAVCAGVAAGSGAAG